MADLNVLIELGLRPEEFLSKNVTTFHQNLGSTYRIITNKASIMCMILKTMSRMVRFIRCNQFDEKIVYDIKFP